MFRRISGFRCLPRTRYDYVDWVRVAKRSAEKTKDYETTKRCSIDDTVARRSFRSRGHAFTRLRVYTPNANLRCIHAYVYTPNANLRCIHAYVYTPNANLRCIHAYVYTPNANGFECWKCVPVPVYEYAYDCLVALDNGLNL